MSEEFFDRSEFVAYFRDETEELLQAIDDDLLRLEGAIDRGGDSELINSLFRALHTVKGSAGMLEFFEIQKLAHGLENMCDLLRKEHMPLSEAVVNHLFEGRDLLTLLVRAAVDEEPTPEGVEAYLARLETFVGVYLSTARTIDGSVEDESLTIDPAAIEAFESEVARMLQAAEAKTADAPAAATDDAVSIAPAPAKSVSASAGPSDAGGARRNSGKHETVRVDIARLDLLLNLVGELVINRTRISDIATTLGRDIAGDGNDSATKLAKELGDSLSLLARTTSEIQESIMKVRMVPVRTVFDRFPRMVRDLAKAYDKTIALEISGADTELDKTIVDEIGEPLMHLVRNSIDHGLELPDERERNGKPRTGTIRLDAYHEGNQIIIEVSDDGAGMDLAKIRARGIAVGLIQENERHSERELIDLVFTPGFSTAAKVTDVSGRGVGMDVVKKNILRLKGVFEVTTAAGVGTTFTIKLPLTLAIIQALLVRVADELYSIPLDSVIETQRIAASDVRTVHRSEVIQLRGSVVPLIRIRSFFELRERNDDAKLMVVIVGLQGRTVGLVVDGFEGEQEIVIKPLSDVIGDIAGISGATILGNGSISLIIDVHSLVTSAHALGRPIRAQLSEV